MCGKKGAADSLEEEEEEGEGEKEREKKKKRERERETQRSDFMVGQEAGRPE